MSRAAKLRFYRVYLHQSPHGYDMGTMGGIPSGPVHKVMCLSPSQHPAVAGGPFHPTVEEGLDVLLAVSHRPTFGEFHVGDTSPAPALAAQPVHTHTDPLGDFLFL